MKTTATAPKPQAVFLSYVSRHATVVALATLLCSLVLGVILIWDRGLYMDDYFFKFHNENLQTGEWQLQPQPFYPGARWLGQLLQQNIAHLMPAYELPARLAWALLHLTCVLLLSLLAYRLTTTPVAGVVTAWLFMMPLAASELLLWFSQPSQHGVAVLLFLLAVYLMLRVLQGAAHPWRASALIALCLGLGLQFSEIAVALAGYAPLLALVVLATPATRANRRRTLLRTLGLLVLGGGLVAMHYLLFIRPYLQTSHGRGEVQLNLASMLTRYGVYLKGLYDATLAPEWGKLIATESFALGRTLILTHPAGLQLLVLLLGGLGLYIATTSLPDGSRRAALDQAGAIVLAGILWMLLALVPTTILTSQMLQGRMLYAPLMGFALAGGGLVWGMLVLLQGLPGPLRRVLLVLPAALLVYSTIAMLGLAQVYKLRAQTDAHTVQELAMIAPSASVPANAIFVVAVPPDVIIADETQNHANTLSVTLLGVFEVPWSCSPALQLAYRRSDIDCISANHWSRGVGFEMVASPNSTTPTLRIGEDLGSSSEHPSDTVIPFTVRRGQVILLNPLVVTSGDGQVLQTIDLPLIRAYERQGVAVEPAQVRPIVER